MQGFAKHFIAVLQKEDKFNNAQTLMLDSKTTLKI